MQDDDVSPEGKEMLSIHSPLQLSIHEQGGEHGQFVINSCEHRWHRACLETAERSSGRRLIRAEGDGRLWVSCQRCRRDGWVEDVESTPSEGESAEVERMVTA